MKNIFNKRTLAAILLAGLSLFAAAQNYNSSPLKFVENRPAVYSPQVMGVMRYDNHAAIDLNTGRITPTIDLLRIKDRDFDFPISLTYNSSGFRPRHADNYVGRDWTLNAGGVVYREVRGIPDDLRGYKQSQSFLLVYTGFLKMLGRKQYDLDAMKKNVAQNPYGYAHWRDVFNSSMLTLPTAISNEEVEASPDIFHFSFGKHSGKFMINYDGTVSVVGYDGGHYEVDLSEMKQFINTTPQETCIRIKTDDGYVYTFGGQGYASLEYKALSWGTDYDYSPNLSTGHNEITAFHLTEIKAPNGRTLRITYRDIEAKYHEYPNTHLVNLYNWNSSDEYPDVQLQYQLSGMSVASTGYLAGSLSGSNGTNVPMYGGSDASHRYSFNKIALIDRIATDECTLEFTYSTREKQPLPVIGGSKKFYTGCGAKLDLIRMMDNGHSESARFTYEYALGNRMFLKSVKTDAEGRFDMAYNTATSSEVPDPLTCNLDHWGFWRGANAHVALIPGMRYSTGSFSWGYTLTTDHRDATGQECDISLLRQMTYPTGGHVEFAYEPHRYSTIVRHSNITPGYPVDVSLSPSVTGLAGGARIRSVRYTDAAGKVQKETMYTYGGLSRSGKVMYMPLYRHMMVQKNSTGSGVLVAVAYDSEGFDNAASRPGIHIRYPEVTEHYIDPSKGGTEQKHSYKKTEFQTALSVSSSYYEGNAYFNTLKTNPDNPNIYQLFEPACQQYFKKIVACPMDDASRFYSKVSRETYYDEDNVMRKKVDYSYDFLNRDNYSLCLFVPNSSVYMFNLFTHIGREYFRMLMPVSVRTTEYYGPQGNQPKEHWECMKYDSQGYLTEAAQRKNRTDSLITVWEREKYGSQVLPVSTHRYMATADGRRLLKRDEMEYDLHRSAWYVLRRKTLFNGEGELVNRIEYPRYDLYGNPVESVENDTRHTVFLWSHHGQSLRARIENATYEKVKAALGKDPELLSPSTGDASALDGIRMKLPDARVHSYWSKYGRYVSEAGGANGRNTHYTYRSGGLLGEVYQYDEDGKKEVIILTVYSLVN